MPRLSPFVVGKFAVFDEIASGGMASVHLGRLLGPERFSRTVAIKRMHPQLAEDPEFVAMFLDEARLMGRLRHANVVQVIDVVAADGALLLAMEYVHGASLSRLLKLARGAGLTPGVACKVVVDVLRGLHEAHGVRSELGEPMHVVHRDVSPENILVGVDGSARVVDFGIAKAAHRAQATTREGQLKGKLGYMAPEQLRQESVDHRTDVYATSVVLWEALTGKRLFEPGNEGRQLTKILFEPVPSPRTVRPEMPEDLEAIVMRGLRRDPAHRYATAEEMADALEATAPARSGEVGALVERLAKDELAARMRRIREIEKETSLPTGIGGSSGVSVALDVPKRPAFDGVPRRSRLTWVAVLGVAALVGVSASWLKISGGARASREASFATGDPAVPTVFDATPAPDPQPSAPPATRTVADPLPPPRPATPKPAEREASSHSVSRPSPRTIPPAVKAQCDPPYLVDSEGIHHLKIECL